jgi:hypothetical protein
MKRTSSTRKPEPRRTLTVTGIVEASATLPARERAVTVTLPREDGPRRTWSARIELANGVTLAEALREDAE